MTDIFDYDVAYSRNIGWVTEAEQLILQGKRIAIAGLGGVGGEHLLTLVRLGITKFNLSDFDSFGCENTNRQAGANIHSYDKKKLDTMVEMALAINPELQINTFPDGIDEENTEEFLKDVDCYVDSLDFFAIDARKRVFAKCAEMGIPATTAAPIGMGTAFLNFLPGQMTFEQYFQLNNHSENEQYLKFFLGLTPAALQSAYLVDQTKLDLANKKGPSTSVGCKLAAGVAGAQVVKILLNRGKVLNVPWGLHFDAYTNQFKKTWRPLGNNNPIQKLAFSIAKKKLLTPQASSNEDIIPTTLAEHIIDFARWAPSGDNTQCWRFKITSEDSFTVIANDTRDSVVYDLDGHSSHLAHGILIETIFLAATKFGKKVKFEQDLTDDQSPKFHFSFETDDEVNCDPRVPYIKTRCVQRRAMGTRLLSEKEKLELESSLPEGYSVEWFESKSEKLAVAKLNFTNAKTRLTMKEAYHVHKEIIEWKSQFSKTKIPEQALGVDYLTARMMQWMFESWQRVKFVNKFLAGTLPPRIALDFIPSIKSCAHFAIKANQPPETIEDYIDAGRAVQRFWLTCAKLDLGFQPEQTPVIFARYLRNDIRFTEQEEVIKNAQKGRSQFEQLINGSEAVHFLGRIGRTSLPKSRSTRIDLKDLIIKE